MRSFLAFLVLVTAACTTTPVLTRDTRDLAEAAPDPLALLDIAFPIGIPVEASAIVSRDAGMSWRILACVEHANVVGFVPARDVDYVNLYLVEQATAADPAATCRYLVTERWLYRPSAGLKICHQWVIWQDDPVMPPSRADYAVLVEDLQNVVLDRRTLDIVAAVLERMDGFYASAVEFFGSHPPGQSDAETVLSPHGVTEVFVGNRPSHALY